MKREHDPAWDDYLAKLHAEQEKEAQLPRCNPSAEWHPVFNPSLAMIKRRDEHVKEAQAKETREALTQSQQLHWWKAVELIKGGGVLSYADLGARFQQMPSQIARSKRADYSALWAYALVQKLIVRGSFTEDEIKRLIRDTSIPKKTRRKAKTAKTTTIKHNVGAYTWV